MSAPRRLRTRVPDRGENSESEETTAAITDSASCRTRVFEGIEPAVVDTMFCSSELECVVNPLAFEQAPQPFNDPGRSFSRALVNTTVERRLMRCFVHDRGQNFPATSGYLYPFPWYRHTNRCGWYWACKRHRFRQHWTLARADNTPRIASANRTRFLPADTWADSWESREHEKNGPSNDIVLQNDRPTNLERPADGRLGSFPYP